MLIVQGVALAMAMVTADAPAASASSKEQRVAAAYQQFEKQRHVEAALEFEALWRDFKEPRFLFNAAVTRYTARHYAHAVAYLNEYLALAEVKGADRDEAKAQLEVARREVSSVQVKVQAEGVAGAPTVTARWVSELASDLRPNLPVPVSPSGAAQSGVIQLDPGTWVIRAEAAGAEPAEVQVKVVAGAPLTAELALKPLPKETGPVGQAPQDTEKKFDGRKIGLATIGVGAGLAIVGGVITGVAQGKEFGPALKAEATECAYGPPLQSCSAELRAGATLRAAGTGVLGAGVGLIASGAVWYARTERARKIAWYVETGVGAAAVIGGIVGLVLTANSFNDVNGTLPAPKWAELQDGVKGPATMFSVSSAAAGLGAGLVAGSALGLGLSRGRTSQYAKALRIGGGPGRGALGLTLSGRF
ncbi:hypothetical protein [Nannocystis punicea]|uniref:PEGA domain-containing protein n=1 Tax=Nannocystis punicea TaxID=2995304 RepID=A0ABY7H9X6_9BACT|nr:hypothetical protein [Nannocystis poenicansa]WAS95900.1 hypothetical protein O0S08_07025 [Nannocystis poenicansa]